MFRFRLGFKILIQKNASKTLKNNITFVRKKAMIQRKQSLYLLLSAITMGLLFVFQIADFPNGFDFYLWKLTNDSVTFYCLPLAIVAILSIFTSIITIFLYKRRTSQIKLCIANFILILSLMILLFWIYPDFILPSEMGNAIDVNYNFTIYAPIVSLIFILLANNAIKKDEKLVKSADRLR